MEAILSVEYDGNMNIKYRLSNGHSPSFNSGPVFAEMLRKLIEDVDWAEIDGKDSNGGWTAEVR